jgi:hypothetical protein
MQILTLKTSQNDIKTKNKESQLLHSSICCARTCAIHFLQIERFGQGRALKTSPNIWNNLIPGFIRIFKITLQFVSQRFILQTSPRY